MLGKENDIAIKKEAEVPMESCSEDQHFNNMAECESFAGDRPLEDENCSGVVERIVICDKGRPTINLFAHIILCFEHLLIYIVLKSTKFAMVFILLIFRR